MVRKPTTSTVEAAANAYIQARRGRAAFRPAPSAGIAAEKVLRPLARRFGIGVEQLREHWPEIVGSRLAQWSSPESLQRSGGIHTLVIRARGPAGAIIQAESRRILERVGTFSGKQAPTRIRVIQASGQAPVTAASETRQRKMTRPQSSSQVSETVETSAEARLLSALDRMSRSIKARDGH